MDTCRVPSTCAPIVGLPVKFKVRHVAAPMVGQSDLAFRMICRRHGADVAYSEMLLSERFISDAAYRSARLQTCDGDRPLVVQFAGDDADTLLAACRLVENMCDAVDLNLGCPQRGAMEGHYGAYLCDKKDWPLVASIVRHLRAHLSIPVFCKIRLQASTPITVEFAKLLAHAGCSLVAVHGRQRGGFVERRKGPADLDAVRRVVDALAPLGVPVLSNGNVRCPADVDANLRATGAAGVMVGEALLANPMVFAGAERTRQNVMLAASSYLEECARHPPHEWAVVQAHVFWLLGKTGGGRSTRFAFYGSYTSHADLREAVEEASTLDEMLQVARKAIMEPNIPLGMASKLDTVASKSELQPQEECIGITEDFELSLQVT